jgi:anti-sigma factor RsiW
MSLHVTNPPEPARRHLDGADFLRFEDAELTAEDRARVTDHLAQCARCAGQRAALLAIAARLRQANQDVVLPPALATPPWHQPRLRATARPARSASRRVRRAVGVALCAGVAVAGLAVAAAASPPLREWLVSHLHPAPVRAPIAERPTAEPTASGTAPHTAEVSFVPTSATLTISLRATSGDSIEIRPTTSEAVHVRGRASAGDPTVIVMPDGLALVSPRGGLAAYSVDVPPNVRVVEIRHRARSLVRLTRETLERQRGWRARLP